MIKYEEVRTITEHTKPVLSLLLLKDKRVASSSWDKTIRIYDPTNNYNCAQSFERHNMDTENYLKIKNNHKNYISDLLLLDDNTFLSCSGDNTIKVWNY